MKTICFITAARSEYGLLKGLMQKVISSPSFRFQLIVTGSHLLAEQGRTIDLIVEDGMEIAEIVDCDLDTSSALNVATSMGRLSEKLADAFNRMRPDYLVVLGDRYELLAICSTAFLMGIPIIHIGGGDKTEGAIDDNVRNAVTMLASYHFPGTESSKDNIIRMRGMDARIWNVGEPGLDAFREETLMNREELAQSLHIDTEKRWVLMTYHPETRESIAHNLRAAANCVEALLSLGDFQVVITCANADPGGNEINDLLQRIAEDHPERFSFFPSLGRNRYLSFMKQVAFVVGNSSSGIIEAPFLRVPVVNIGNRQKGRYQCQNVFQSDFRTEEIKSAITLALETDRRWSDCDYWGDGYFAEKTIHILENNL